MASEGLIVQTGEDAFIGGAAPNWMKSAAWFWAWAVTALIVVFGLIVPLSTGISMLPGWYYLPASTCGLVEVDSANASMLPDRKLYTTKASDDKKPSSESGFGNRTRATMMPSGANPNTGAQEGSQPGAGGYGRQWDPRTGRYVYIRPEFDKLDRTLDASIQGTRASSGFAGGPNYNNPSYRTWARDDREKKAMRMYSDLRRAYLDRGEEMTQSFADWYKTYKQESVNRLASDVYYTDGMSSRPLNDSDLMSRGRNGY